VRWHDGFSGAGGSSTGIIAAGHRVVAAGNHWPVAVQTHEANHPGTRHFLANLSEMDWRTWPRADAAWFSPSCVWHARSGGRKSPPAEVELMMGDAGSVDRATALAVIAAAEVHQYAAVIVENVPEFTAWSLYPWWLDGMHHLGYQAQTTVLDAYDVGEAQHRKRWFGVFTRMGDVDLTLPVIERRNADAILDPDPGPLVTRRLYVADQLDEIEDLNIPHLVTYRRHAHARRANEYPLATITAGGNHHAVATRMRDGMHCRMLTLPERAAGMGFPDGYRFIGTKADQLKCIGNAVSIRTASFLATRVAATIERTHP
jgi:DNA (cytosine-5)-methyltransferase 1